MDMRQSTRSAQNKNQWQWQSTNLPFGHATIQYQMCKQTNDSQLWCRRKQRKATKRTNQLSHVGHAKIINQLTKSLLHCQLNYASPASITARRRSLANWPSTLSWKPSTTQAGSVVNKEHLLSSQTQTGCHYYFYTQQSTMFRIKTDTEDQK